MSSLHPHVRIATWDDEAGILALCWQAHEEMPAGRALAPRKVEGMVTSVLAGNGVIGVIEVERDIRAMIGLIASSSWYSDDLELHDWLAFVRPDCRALRYFTPLLTFAKQQATLRGLPLWLGFIGDDRVMAKGRAYHRALPKYGELFRFDPHEQAA